MCDIAPFQMECDLEEHKEKLMSCNICRLHWALNELWSQVPIVKHLVVPYKCPNFRIKRRADNG